MTAEKSREDLSKIAEDILNNYNKVRKALDVLYWSIDRLQRKLSYREPE